MYQHTSWAAVASQASSRQEAATAAQSGERLTVGGCPCTNCGSITSGSWFDSPSEFLVSLSLPGRGCTWTPQPHWGAPTQHRRQVHLSSAVQTPFDTIWPTYDTFFTEITKRTYFPVNSTCFTRVFVKLHKQRQREAGSGSRSNSSTTCMQEREARMTGRQRAV